MTGLTNGALSPFSKMTNTALALDPGMPRDEWEALGVTLRTIEAGVGWWIGDWWAYGEREYGEAASQAAPTGFAAKTLANYAWVARSIEPSRRREDLSVGHHEAVAGMDDPADQDAWLDKAATNEWTVAETRARIRNDHIDLDVPSETVKLLRRAVDAYKRDPAYNETGRRDFLDLAEMAWQFSHGLTGPPLAPPPR